MGRGYSDFAGELDDMGTAGESEPDCGLLSAGLPDDGSALIEAHLQVSPTLLHPSGSPTMRKESRERFLTRTYSNHAQDC
jgi:hypothetical protein